MEEAGELANYLPLSFKTATEQEYIEFLRDAFQTNYTHRKYRSRSVGRVSGVRPSRRSHTL
ncbi:MAG TPA: hypothetical protein VN959_19030 [Mycobacterium sp.]|nr:hypothetical protein [Mycobacterium sp.]